jgi:hypothetical protein
LASKASFSSTLQLFNQGIAGLFLSKRALIDEKILLYSPKNKVRTGPKTYRPCFFWFQPKLFLAFEYSLRNTLRPSFPTN